MLCMNSVPNIILLIEMFIIFIRPSSNMVSSKTVYTRLFAFCGLLLMQTAKNGTFLKNSGNLLHDRHKNFENRFRNS